jgi:hypothetical protein
MGRDNLIIGAVLAAFFIYVSAKGDLASYLADLGIGAAPWGGAPGSGTPPSASTTTGSAPNFGTVGNFLTRPGQEAPPAFYPPPYTGGFGG